MRKVSQYCSLTVDFGRKDTVLFTCKHFTRGEVENTRLEAKAKDTKKKNEAKAKNSLSEDRTSRGQGQECSRPMTKDTAASVFKKQKGFQKSFSGDLQFIGVPRIFDQGRSKPQITCNDVIKIFPKRKYLWAKIS